MMNVTGGNLRHLKNKDIELLEKHGKLRVRTNFEESKYILISILKIQYLQFLEYHKFFVCDFRICVHAMEVFKMLELGNSYNYNWCVRK